ncbi:MAG TPA: DUF421 domain-containing protein [Firmicutes bacterium]|nr:DUF421 domain-containing protein [Bacillota bacterium]HOQ24111.1 DUF421 domain-containing protein [Bacillota bacterium]HPT66417.1 DUF421 domain-containing protein [Bacillota bacterium]
MLIIFFRTLILYLLVLVILRLMGKRQIGQLQPFEFVVTLMIADLVAVPMQDKEIALINGVVPVLTLLFAQVAISYLSLKSGLVRRIICGRPSVLVANGQIVRAELQRNLFNLNDLSEQLRTKGYANLGDVEFAVLETNGELSVVPKSQKRPVTPADLQIPTSYEGLPLLLIIDGKIQGENLAKAGLTTDWLLGKLRESSLTPKTTLVAILDSQGGLFLQKK